MIGGGIQDNIFYRCVEDCNEAIMIADMSGILTYVNPAWSHIYGYSRDDALGKTPRLLHSGFQKPQFYKDMWEDIRNSKIGFWKGELVNRAQDGSLVPVYLTITPYRDSEGIVKGFMGVALDMRAQKDLEAKVMHQDRLASVGVIASGLAHEIGTPLSVIRGRAELMLESMSVRDCEEFKNLEIIMQQVDRISYFMHALLGMGRKSVELRVEKLDLNNVLNHIFSIMDQTFKSEEIEFTMSGRAEKHIIGDAQKIEQILLNLLTNALHAVKLAKKSHPEKQNYVRLSLIQNEAGAFVSVIDSGIGFAPDQIKNLFQPFYTTKNTGEGTGLGLAISLQIAQSMGGTIIPHRDSEAEETHFTVEFRLSEDEIAVSNLA